MKAIKKQLQSNIWIYALVALLIISTIPIIIVGLNARPHLDDVVFSASSSFRPQGDINYYFERSVRHAVLYGNIIDVARAVWFTIRDNYVQWQGTYSAIAVFSIHPGVLIAEEAYPLTMVFTLGTLLFATYFMCKTIWEKPLLPFALLAFLSVQLLPSLANGFFWWNGATYYTTFYSILLVNVACKIRFVRDNGKHYVPVIVVLNFFVAGGNFVTALLGLEIAFLFLAYAVWKKKHIIPLAVAFIASGAGFLISILAPGNAMRQYTGITPDPIQAVIMSPLHAAGDILRWTLGAPIIVVVLLLMSPLIWKWVGTLKFDFPYPFAVMALSFLLFSSMQTPTLYALGHPAFVGGKIHNVLFYAYLWLMLSNFCYLVGWLRRKYHDAGMPYADDIIKWITSRRRYLYGAIIIVTASAFLISIPRSSFALCISELRSGVVHAFATEYRQRLEILRDETQYTPALAPFSAHPFTLVPYDEGENELGDARFHALFYRRGRIITLPQYRPVAMPNLIPLRAADGRELDIYSFSINDFDYVRLRDLAFALQDVFDVEGSGRQASIVTGAEYTPVGRELNPVQGWHIAQLTYETIQADTQMHRAIGYEVNGELFWRLYCLTPIIDVQINWDDQRLNLSSPNFPTATPNHVAVQTFDNRYVDLPAYIIHDFNHVRLRDLAYVLHYVFDVACMPSGHVITTGAPYSAIGIEMEPVLYMETARQIRQTILADGCLRYVTAFYIGGDVFYRLTDLLQVVSVEMELRDDRLRFMVFYG